MPYSFETDGYRKLALLVHTTRVPKNVLQKLFPNWVLFLSLGRWARSLGESEGSLKICKSRKKFKFRIFRTDVEEFRGCDVILKYIFCQIMMQI